MVRLLAFGSVVGLGAAGGGWSATVWGWAALVLCGVSAAALIVDPRRPSPPELALLAGLALLTAWTGLSTIWSASVPSSVLEVERDLVYVAGAAAALLVGGDELEDGVLGACVVLCAWNLVTQVHGYDASIPGADAEPIGYANGLGLVAAIGTLLALRRRITLPALAILVPALVLARSDGSYLALACGLVVALRPRLAPLVAVAAAVLVVAGLHSHQRAIYWNVAVADAGSHLAIGSGAGTYAQEWIRRRPTALQTHDAHSLELQTLAELGVVGLAILAGTLVLPFARSGGGAALGAYTAWIVQSGIDWEWQLPAVTLAGLLCGLAALRGRPVLRRRPESPPLGSLSRAVGVTAAASVGALALVGLVGNSAIASARDALRAGNVPEALAAARTGRRWAPWSAEPWRIESQARGGDRAALRRAIALDPNDWSLWAELAAASSGNESRRAAARAARLNPLGSTAPSG
jgi:hypothetical protein